VSSELVWVQKTLRLSEQFGQTSQTETSGIIRLTVAKRKDIEHIDAVETAVEVVSTPALHVVFIGPGDLATSMGLRGRSDHPDM